MLTGLLALAAPPSGAAAELVFEHDLEAAEAHLRRGETAQAEARYGALLTQAWMLMGDLEVADGRLAEAQHAFARAVSVSGGAPRAVDALALAHLRASDPKKALQRLVPEAEKRAGEPAVHRLLAQAWIADGQTEKAVEELEKAARVAGNDAELVFALGTDHLRLGRVEQAEALFQRVLELRPGPEALVLIGRVYRESGEYERARAALHEALKKDPRVRRAHFYLGMIAAIEKRAAGIEEAIAEFSKERRLTPDDRLVNQQLGIALVEARRHGEAEPFLVQATAADDPASAAAFLYLGKCQLARGAAAEAVKSFRRALELAPTSPEMDREQMEIVHYQLASALQRQGATEEAARHFEEAQRHSGDRLTTERAEHDRMQRKRETAEGTIHPGRITPLVETSPVARLAPEPRRALRQRVTAAIARSHFNLGVLDAQRGRPQQAVEHLQNAAQADPQFPDVQYALGVSLFNAGRFQEAAGPLERALSTRPEDPGLRRMLAMASIEAGAYERGASLLRLDPGRDADPKLAYAYGLALARSGQALDAQEAFRRLLVRHGDSAEVNVLLGQAYVDDQRFDEAIRTLEHALRLKPDIADAQATLGTIYLKQGKLAEAEKALRAELAAHPGNVTARHRLAVVLEMDDRAADAVPLLREVITRRPDLGDAQYVLGKLLLAGGHAAEAVEHLEASVRLQPDDPSSHFQLAQAYRRLGRVEAADTTFATYQKLKEKRREAQP